MTKSHTFSTNDVMWLSIFCFFILSELAPFVFPIESRMGGILLVGLLVLILVIGLMQNNFKIRLIFTPFHTVLLCFSLFCLLSSTWALQKDIALSRGVDLVKICLGMFVIYFCIEKQEAAAENLLKCIMWSGYILGVYSLVAYGWKDIITVISSSSRLSNDFINANVIGMAVAYSLLIHAAFILHKKRMVILLPFAMIAVLILIASGSRKAFFILFIGTGLLLICKNSGNKNALRSVTVIGVALLIEAIVLFVLMKLHAFSGIEERIQGLLSALSGQGVADYSAMIRLQLISIGKDIFRENMFFGIGIDNAIVVVEQILGRSNYYLHNNYVELMADVGIVGTAIYYSIYVVILLRLIKYRRFSEFDFDICFTMLVIYLIMDYGAVTYNQKHSYIILMYFWLASEKNRIERISLRE